MEQEDYDGEATTDDVPDAGDVTSEQPALTEDSVEAFPNNGVGFNGEGDGNVFTLRDSKYLLGIFPREVWIPILDKLDSNSLESVSSASPFFRHLLLRRRIHFLFPKVWNVIAVKYYKAPMPGSETGMILYGTDPEIEKERTRRWSRWHNETLPLRLVCRTWTAAIDSLYQNLPNHLDFPETCGDVCNWYRFTFMDALVGEYTRRFLRHFDKTHGTGSGLDRSPFLGRSITIWQSDDPNADLVKIHNLLDKHGHHVWSCYLTISINNGTRIEWYGMVKSMLERMPNLKHVKLAYGGKLLSCDDELSTDVICKAIHRNPLPTMANLQCIKTKNLNFVIFNEFIRQTNQISMLKVERETYHVKRDAELYVPYLLESLSNLKHLEIKLFAEEEIKSLELSPDTWRLERLTLLFMEHASVEWLRIFTLLESKWGSTLTHVTLDMPSGMDPHDILRDCASYRLNLPKIKSFKVTLGIASSLDFILPMKDTLEYLEVSISYRVNRTCKLYHSVRRQQMIEFLGFDEKLLESNIWNLFRKLQQIDVVENGDRFTHSRREWEEEMTLLSKNEKKVDIATQTDDLQAYSH